MVDFERSIRFPNRIVGLIFSYQADRQSLKDSMGKALQQMVC